MKNILVIAPHPDDEVLGVGGTIAKHFRQGDKVYLCVVTKGYPPQWPEEIVKREKEMVSKVARMLAIEQVYFLDFPTVKLDTISSKELNDSIAKIVSEVQPEVVYIPHRGDINKDHQLVFDATMVATRPKPGAVIKKVLSYETLSETEWAAPFEANAFLPQVFVDISETLETKLKAMSIYETELKQYPHPRSLEAIAALAKVRGATVGVKAAEAFMLIREILV